MFPRLLPRFSGLRRHQKVLVAAGKRPFVGLAACLGVVGALAVATPSGVIWLPPANATAQVMELLNTRSPGSRPPGARTSKRPLSKAAPTQQLNADREREATALPQTRTRTGPAVLDVDETPELLSSGVPLTLASADLPQFFIPLSDILPTALASATSTGPLVAPPTAGFGGGGGGAFGPISSSPVASPLAPGPTTPPGDVGIVTPATPVSAVPEPGTWLTMIIGFGAVGVQLRRRRSVGSFHATPPS